MVFCCARRRVGGVNTDTAYGPLAACHTNEQSYFDACTNGNTHCYAAADIHLHPDAAPTDLYTNTGLGSRGRNGDGSCAGRGVSDGLNGC